MPACDIAALLHTQHTLLLRAEWEQHAQGIFVSGNRLTKLVDCHAAPLNPNARNAAVHQTRGIRKQGQRLSVAYMHTAELIGFYREINTFAITQEILFPAAGM